MVGRVEKERRIVEDLGGLKIGSILLAFPFCILPKLPFGETSQGAWATVQQKRIQSDQSRPQLDATPTRSLLRIFTLVEALLAPGESVEPSL